MKGLKALKYTDGGVTAPSGFSASGVHCGVKRGSSLLKLDLALIFSETECTAAGVFTRNSVKAAPVLLDMDRLKSGKARAIIANSGNANACAPGAYEAAELMACAAASSLGISPSSVLVASTGVIGQVLNTEAIISGIEPLVKNLGKNSSDAADAIMTTDTFRKETAAEFSLSGGTARIGAICKGSGMIHPNMGTLLCFITTDAAISADMLSRALRVAVNASFNRVSVDGDTSTNDSCIILASGLCGSPEITAEDDDYKIFVGALTQVCVRLARMIAGDGEGATHLITCRVSGASTDKDAETLAMSVIKSPLTKAAIFGADANVGRVLCAIGYSGAFLRPDMVDIIFTSENGSVIVCEKGLCLAFDETLAKNVLEAWEVVIDIRAGDGPGSCECWGCDLTYDYVRINGDYRS